MANINYTATADLKSFSTWLTNNVNQSASTWDSTTQEGVLVLNSGVTSIGLGAFQNCTAITKVIIGEGVTSISQDAFNGVSNLTYAELPSTLTSLGYLSFWNCNKLKFVYCKAIVPPTGAINSNFTLSSGILFVNPSVVNDYNNSNWASRFSAIYPYNGNGVITYHSSSDLSNYSSWITNNAISTTYDSTTQIGTIEVFPYEIGIAFQNCSTITEVSITNIIRLENFCFYNCTSLTSVSFDNSLRSIGDSAFSGCTNLTLFTVPTSVTRISRDSFMNTEWWNSQSDGIIYKDNWCFGYKGNRPTGSLTINYCIHIAKDAFTSCIGLTEVTFTSSLTTVGENAFKGCSSVTQVILSNSIITIENNTFQNCTGLTSVTFGTSLTSIGQYAFAGCTSLATIYWNAINVTTFGTGWRSNCPIDTVIFGDSVVTIGSQIFLNCTSLTQVTFGESLATIGERAFAGCTGLTSITLPESLMTINNNTFGNCSNLLSVTSLATTPPTLGSSNFTAYGDTLYVIGSSKAAYEANTAWRNAFTNIKGIYTVTTSAGENGTITPTTEVLEGESFTVTATPNEHYKVSHFVVDGVDVGTIDNYTFQNLDADHTIHVDFELITHTITATTYEGGAIVPSGTITVTDGDDVTFDIIPLEGYGILAVFIDGTQIEPAYSYTFTDVEADHTIQAMFYKLRSNGFNRDEMLDTNYILQDYLEQLKKRD